MGAAGNPEPPFTRVCLDVNHRDIQSRRGDVSWLLLRGSWLLPPVVVSTCARDAGTHGDVLNVHTGRFWMDSRRFFSIPHTKHNTNATSHGDGQRESEKEDRERGERRDDARREEGGRERRKKKKYSVLTCTRVACTCRRHSFCSFYHAKRSLEHLLSMMSAFRSF